MWQKAQHLVGIIDSSIANLFTVDKVKIALYVTWLWAWAGLYTTKIFEAFFTSILKIPDKWLAIPVGDVTNTSGQKIHILSAKSGNLDITNKLKIFMKLYWEKGGINDANNTNGFDFSKLAKMLNVSMMYCCYLLTDANGDIQPEQFWNSVHTFLVEQTKSGECYRSMKTDLSDRHKLWLRNVDFEGSYTVPIRNQSNQDDSLDEYDDDLDAYIRAGTTCERISKPMTLPEIQAQLLH